MSDNLNIQLECVSITDQSYTTFGSLSKIPHMVYDKQDQGEINKEVKKVNFTVNILDQPVIPRAIASLPGVLQLRRGLIYPRRPIPAYARFGPLQGTKHLLAQYHDLCQHSTKTTDDAPQLLVTETNGCVMHVDVSDKDKSNWLGTLSLGDQTSANVWLYEENGELYGITTKTIQLRTPLKLGYSKAYVDTYKILSNQPVMDLNFENPVRWWCYECKRAMSSATMLQRHTDVYHKRRKHVSRQIYRCTKCTKRFSRLFTLRRHAAKHCTTKLNSKPSEKMMEVIVQVPPTSTSEQRISSDESFQNFTNSLDFSTNLFDADIRCNLDISGGSRSETEFNPYGVDYTKEDQNMLDKYLGQVNVHQSQRAIQNKTVQSTRDTLPCPHCNQIVDTHKKLQHSRKCPGKRLECACGRHFSNKELLSQHIQSKHSADPEVSQTPEASYDCNDCGLKFKRRGMYVNHLWRVHDQRSPAVALEKKIRHYPCAACPKIYRSAAKRDRHVETHHPGATVKRSVIEGGKKCCEPAACTECPRQYTTRGKLLQHIRSHHAHLVPLLTKKIILKSDAKKV